MARTGSGGSSKAVSKEEKKNTEVVCCMDCLWAGLIRYGSNPVLAECHKKPTPESARFPYQREVASARWICPMWRHDGRVKEIEQRVARQGLTGERVEAVA